MCGVTLYWVPEAFRTPGLAAGGSPTLHSKAMRIAALLRGSARRSAVSSLARVAIVSWESHYDGRPALVTIVLAVDGISHDRNPVVLQNES